jgi:hypothetical protein
LATKSLRTAEQHWRRIGNSFWRLYCAIGAADAMLYRGDIELARWSYERLRSDNTFSGWTSWMDGHPIVHLADIARVQGRSAHDLRTWAQEMAPLLDQRADPALSDVARAVTVAIESQVAESSDVGRLNGVLTAILNSHRWDGEDRLSFDLLRAELLMSIGSLSHAEALLVSSACDAEKRHLGFISLRIRILLLELDRRAKRPLSWRDLLRDCDELRFDFGLAYVVAIAVAGGCPVSAHRRRRAQEWAAKNQVGWLVKAVQSAVEPSERSGELPIRFPFFYF